MYKPELRIKWDTSVKKTEKIQGDDFNYVIHNHMHSPIFFISERDTLEKRVQFNYGELFYSLSTSVNDSLKAPDPKVIRCKTLINLYIVSQDEEHYYFISFNQLDIKVII